jgi:DNA-binding CsgD family transcriptional regulator
MVECRVRVEQVSPAAEDRAHALLAELADCAQDHSASSEVAPAAGAEVVLDAVVNGVRYQLLRAVPRAEGVALSSRELEIARMVAKGHTNRTIAAVLDISQWTVSIHLRRVYAKLNVGSRAAMTARLGADGLLPPGAGPPGVVRMVIEPRPSRSG